MAGFSGLDRSERVVCQLVGDSGEGIGSLISRFVSDTFGRSARRDENIKNQFYLRDVDLDGDTVCVVVYDRAIEADYPLKDHHIHDTIQQCVVYAYDSTDLESLNRLLYWNQEVSRFNHDDTVSAIVYTKCDLTPHDGFAVITALAGQLGIHLQFKTSAKTGEGVEEMFTALARAVIAKRPKKLQSKEVISIRSRAEPQSAGWLARLKQRLERRKDAVEESTEVKPKADQTPAQQKESSKVAELKQSLEQVQSEEKKLVQQLESTLSVNEALKSSLEKHAQIEAELRDEVGQCQKRLAEIGAENEQNELARHRIKSYQLDAENHFVGNGSYGSVHRVRVNNIPCIAKKILDILVGRGREAAVSENGKRAIQEKFRQECVFLSRMRHPNIVQFMGVHYPEDNPLDLTLIMEFLPMDLEKCVEKHSKLPPSMKISILLDVSYGLVHLHNASIIHRDLSAANVLLTPSFRAKITDFGVSKLLDIHPRDMTKQSALPGALGYMPPEALWENPEYGTKLDIFSFGVLALYTAVQCYPTFYELPRQEVEDIQIKKRMKWIRLLSGKECGCLEPLVLECLKDSPAERPETERVNFSLEELSLQFPRVPASVVELEQEIAELKRQVAKLKQKK